MQFAMLLNASVYNKLFFLNTFKGAMNVYPSLEYLLPSVKFSLNQFPRASWASLTLDGSVLAVLSIRP